MGEFGDRLKEARAARGWTQARLAREAGMSVNQVHRLEGSAVGASQTAMQAICDALHVRVPWLASGDGPMTDGANQPPVPDSAQFGTRLTQARTSRGWSRVRLARELGMNEKTLYKYEKGTCRPSGPVMEALCNTLRVSAAWLEWGEGPARSGSHGQEDELAGAGRKKFAARLRKAREHRGMSRTDLTRAARVSAPTVRRHEEGSGGATSAVIEAYSHALRVNSLWLETGEGPMDADEEPTERTADPAMDTKLELESFSKRLKRARQERGWTQTYLGFRAGIGKGRMARLEREEAFPDAASVQALARALEVREPWLASGEGPVAQESQEEELAVPDLAQFGARVRQARLDRGWTQDRLAMELGIPKTAENQLERGVLFPKDGTVQKLARPLGVAAAWLATGEGPKDAELHGAAPVAPLDMEGLPARLRKARRVHGWTRRDLARNSGISREAMKDYEEGVGAPGQLALQELAQTLDVDLEWLASGEGPMKAGEAAGTFASRMRTVRRARGWSLERLSRAAGVSLDTVWRYEQGDAGAQSPSLGAVCRALGVRPAWLMHGTGPMDAEPEGCPSVPEAHPAQPKYGGAPEVEAGAGAPAGLSGFPIRLRRVRQSLGWNQTELSTEAGMAPSAVTRLETGRNLLEPASAEKLASLLGVNVSWLIYGSGRMSADVAVESEDRDGEAPGAATNFGERLRLARQERKWTLARLAAEAGVSKGTTWNHEAGRTDPDLLQKTRYAEALRVSPAWLVFEAGPMEAEDAEAWGVSDQDTVDDLWDVDMEVFPNHLAQARAAKGLSRKALAHLSGASDTGVAAYENGTRRPGRRVVDALANALDVSGSWLGAGRDPMNGKPEG